MCNCNQNRCGCNNGCAREGERIMVNNGCGCNQRSRCSCANTYRPGCGCASQRSCPRPCPHPCPKPCPSCEDRCRMQYRQCMRNCRMREENENRGCAHEDYDDMCNE